MFLMRFADDVGLPLSRPPAGADPEVRRRYIRRVRYVYGRVLLRHFPRPYDGRITLLLSTGAPAIYAAAWGALARGGVGSHTVAGDHETYIRDHADATGAALGACLARARQNQSP